MADKETHDTKTFMLPDWEIANRKKSIDDALLFAELSSADKPHEVIGYLKGALKLAHESFTRAKPTKQETFYGVGSLNSTGKEAHG